MSTKRKLSWAGAIIALAALAPLAVGCAGSGAQTTGSTTPPATTRSAHVAVTTRDTELVVTGVGALPAGFVRIAVRNEGTGQHGIALVGLKRPLSSTQLLRAFATENGTLLEALGGVQRVVPGRTWEMTEALHPGSYALIDFGENGAKPNYARGLYKRFRVGPARAESVPPRAVGEIELRDFRFGLGFPRHFSGRGVVKVSNVGSTSHEISLVQIDRGHTQRDVLDLILAGSNEPPAWASVVEVLGMLAPRKTVFLRLDLRPGRYVALCLMDEPRSQQLHAQLGMIGSFEVG